MEQMENSLDVSNKLNSSSNNSDALAALAERVEVLNKLVNSQLSKQNDNRDEAEPNIKVSIELLKMVISDVKEELDNLGDTIKAIWVTFCPLLLQIEAKSGSDSADGRNELEAALNTLRLDVADVCQRVTGIISIFDNPHLQNYLRQGSRRDTAEQDCNKISSSLQHVAKLEQNEPVLQPEVNQNIEIIDSSEISHDLDAAPPDEAGTIAPLSSPKQSDARAGNLPKLIDAIAIHGVDINTCNASGLNALHLASKEGHVEIVRELLRRHIDVNQPTHKGNTALHIASLAGQFEVAKVLIENGALVNAQSQNGFTPLYMAAQENHLEVVTLLLANGANPSITTVDGFTPLAVALQQGHDRTVAVLLESDARGKVCLPALHIAAKKDDVKAASLLLNGDVNVDHQSASGFTALHIASHYGNVKMVDLLISRGADINFQAKNNVTALHVASKWGNVAVVERLLASGAELECFTRDGLTPLHCASRSGHAQVVQLLLNAGANYFAKTRSGLTALHMAAQGDHPECVKLLLLQGANVDDVTIDNLTALHVSAHCGSVRVAKILLDAHSNLNARARNGFTPLHIACKKNRIKVVELFLKHGCMVDVATESGLTPLHVAAFMGNTNIVVLLLKHSADPNGQTMHNETSLHLASRAGRIETVKLLLRNGAIVDAKSRGNQTCLHVAALLGNCELITVLLQNGANVQAVTKDGHSALHVATKAGHDEAVSLLLESGAPTDVLTKSGFTPLHLAAKYSRLKPAQLLIEAGAQLDVPGRNGLTPLHLASHYGSVSVVKALLDKGVEVARLLLKDKADPNAESRNGFTPLHLAAQDGSVEMVCLLLDHKAKVNARAKNGLTPMHLAAQEDSVKAAEVLYAAGALLDPTTKAGYTPLHTACHFGQVLRRVTTCVESWEEIDTYDEQVEGVDGGPAEPKATADYFNSHRASGIPRLELEKPDLMAEHPVTDTEDDQGEVEYTAIPPSPMFSRAVSQQAIEEERVEQVEAGRANQKAILRKQLSNDNAAFTRGGARLSDKHSVVSGEDSIDEGIGYTINQSQFARDKDANGVFVVGNGFRASGQRLKRADRESKFSGNGSENIGFSSGYGGLEWDFVPDNAPICRKPITSGFLVSFLVDARGGSMRASRHPGLRIMVPPSAASAPTRVTCRMLRPERTTAPPQLNDGEGLACRIIELGPHPCQFNSPVLLEIPHFAALRGRQREIVVLRSDDAETWKEHSLEATDQAVRNALGSVLDTLETTEQLKEKRILRVLMSDFPQYLAVVSRLRQEIALIGSDGGVLSSTVVPQVQAVFPEGALQKRIRVGLQAHQIPSDMVTRLVGTQVTVSPIVTIEPRRRKFHKPITLTIPLPRSAVSSKQHHGGAGADSAANSSLRLLCSITGGTASAVWEDITGSTPLSRVKDCVSFTTTVSARLWLIDCLVINAAVEVAMRLYKEATAVPYMGKFIVFAKRPEVDEALMRCFCITDDKVDKTLECQEGFDLVAASNEIEVVDNRPTWLESSGNLAPVVKADDQLRLHFNAFRENRLAFPVRIKDPQLEPSGKLAFVRDPRPGSVNEIKPMLQVFATSTNCRLNYLSVHKVFESYCIFTEQELGGTTIKEALPVRSICGLEVVLPSEIGGTRSGSVLISGADGAHTIASTTAATSVVSLSCSQPQHFEHPIQNLPDTDSHGRCLVVPPPEWATSMTVDSIARTHLDLVEIATQIGSDWPRLVKALFARDSSELPPSADQLIDWISRRCASADTLSAAGLTYEGLRCDRDRALAILLAWTIEAGDAATGNELDVVLRQIGREDIVKNCMRDIRPVLELDEREKSYRELVNCCFQSSFFPDQANEQINSAGQGWGPETPSTHQEMRVTSLSSDFSTEHLASGQLESMGDLVGERGLHAMEFSLPLGEEGASEAQITSTLEPSSPENVEPVERAEVTLLPRAEPEISELSTTEQSQSFAVTDSEVPLSSEQAEAQTTSADMPTTPALDMTSREDGEDVVECSSYCTPLLSPFTGCGITQRDLDAAVTEQ
ncbi:Ankyrin-3 [Echinococcus granulosus]|uniref:Ankyrin-3 n=1 Tax=Echinococcus granulosus TaxID=6210 RepID=W6UAM2_ECHGR|nr:Ankyrin-3 [Echinococcus granulosus]EUB55507.1 Ankyrin-3 [Echinococcus granulosus]